MIQPVATVAPAAPDKARYRRGAETRTRILAVALPAFGMKGFDAVSTRDIAVAAQVNLPAIQYYFGNKQGLYRACADHIVERYVAAALPVGTAAQAALSAGAAADVCHHHLQQVLAALGQFLMRSDESLGWSLFIQRELAEPGAAFDILFERLWRPGVDLVAQLIAAARGGASGSERERLEAIHMISGVTALASGRAAIDRLLATPLSNAALADEVARLIARQVAAVVRNPADGV